MSEFKNEGGQISGKIATDGKAEAFGQTWEVNLIFKTKALVFFVVSQIGRVRRGDYKFSRA